MGNKTGQFQRRIFSPSKGRAFPMRPALLIFALLASCAIKPQPVQPSPQGIDAQSKLDAINSGAVDAHTHLVNATQQLTAAPISAFTVSAATEVKAATVSVDSIPPLVAAAKPDVQKLSDDLVAETKLANAYLGDWNDSKSAFAKYQSDRYNDWLGPRAHRWLFWLCLGAGLLATGYVFLMAAPEIGIPALAGTATVLGHLMTFGLKFVGQWIGKVLAWIVEKIGAAGSAMSTQLAKAAPAAAVVKAASPAPPSTPAVT
jgi:hypothetical protein